MRAVIEPAAAAREWLLARFGRIVGAPGETDVVVLHPLEEFRRFQCVGHAAAADVFHGQQEPAGPGAARSYQQGMTRFR